MSRLDDAWPYFIDGQPTSRQVADAYVKLVEERDELERRVAALTAENERWKAQLENVVAAADQPPTHDGSVLVGNAWMLNVSKALDDARIAVGRLPHDTVRANEIESAAAVASTRETQT